MQNELTMAAGAGAGTGTATAPAPAPAPTRKPSSPRRIAASRANGRLSRGPQSPQGKLNSASSNRKHGFYALSTPAIDPESLASLIEAYKPQSPYQLSLLLTMAESRALETRVETLQTEQLEAAITLTDPALSPQHRAAFAFRNLSDESNSLTVGLRLLSRYGRTYERALAALDRSQKQNRKLSIDPNPEFEQLLSQFKVTNDPKPDSCHPSEPSNLTIDPSPKSEQPLAPPRVLSLPTKPTANLTMAASHSSTDGREFPTSPRSSAHLQDPLGLAL